MRSVIKEKEKFYLLKITGTHFLFLFPSAEKECRIPEVYWNFNKYLNRILQRNNLRWNIRRSTEATFWLRIFVYVIYSQLLAEMESFHFSGFNRQSFHDATVSQHCGTLLACGPKYFKRTLGRHQNWAGNKRDNWGEWAWRLRSNTV